MPSPSTPPPSTLRLFGLGVAASLACAALLAIPLSNPSTQVNEFEPWWDSVGTAAATVSILRALGVALAGWIVLLTFVGLLAGATQNVALIRVWQLTAPAALRRAALVSAVVAATSTPAVALAAETAEPLPVLRDLGPAEAARTTPAPALIDLGTADGSDGGSNAEPADDPVAIVSEREVEVWIVERGDHLWSVAAETVAERGGSPTDATITRFWQQVIELNRDAIGPDPDLIHPGMVLLLP